MNSSTRVAETLEYLAGAVARSPIGKLGEDWEVNRQSLIREALAGWGMIVEPKILTRHKAVALEVGLIRRRCSGAPPNRMLCLTWIIAGASKGRAIGPTGLSNHLIATEVTGDPISEFLANPSMPRLELFTNAEGSWNPLGDPRPKLMDDLKAWAQAVREREPEVVAKPRQRRKRNAPKEKVVRALTLAESNSASTVAKHGGNIAAAARELGRDPKTVRENAERARSKLTVKRVSRSVDTGRIPRDRREKDGDDD